MSKGCYLPTFVNFYTVVLDKKKKPLAYLTLCKLGLFVMCMFFLFASLNLDIS